MYEPYVILYMWNDVLLIISYIIFTFNFLGVVEQKFSGSLIILWNTAFYFFQFHI